MPIPALIGALGSLAGGMLSNAAAANAQDRSIAAQRSLQQMLMTGGAQMARTAKQAGLSPAFSLGQSSTPAASAPASNFANYDFSSFSNLLGSIAQRKLQKQQEKVAEAETRKVSADAGIAEEKHEQEKINTADMRANRGVFKEDIHTLDENGEPVVISSPYQGEKGAWYANLEKQKAEYESSDYRLKILQNDWSSKIYRGRDLRDDITQAVIEMPLLERNELVERINNFREDVNLKRTQEALNECMSIYYMLSGSLQSAQTGLIKQETAENKAGSTAELWDNFSLKQLGKYLTVHGSDLIKSIGSLK